MSEFRYAAEAQGAGGLVAQAIGLQRSALAAIYPLSVISTTASFVPQWIQMRARAEGRLGLEPTESLVILAASLLALVSVAAVLYQLHGRAQGQSTGIGESLGVGVRRGLLLLLAGLIIGVAAALVFFGALTLIGPQALAATALSPWLLVLVPLLLLFSVRLLLCQPQIVLAGRGPIDGLVDGWRLSSGSTLRLLGAFVIVLVLVLIGVLVAGLVAGFAGGLIGIALGETGQQLVVALITIAITAAINLPLVTAFTLVAWNDALLRNGDRDGAVGGDDTHSPIRDD